MPFPPGNELEAWLLDWLDDIGAGAHPESEPAVDLLVAFFEDLGLFLDEQEATNDDYQRITCHTTVSGESACDIDRVAG